MRAIASVSLTLAGLLAGCSGGGTSPDRSPAAACEPSGLISTGEELPDCTFERFDGGTIGLTALRGRPLVLNFWASWCTFCIKEMPDFQRVYADLTPLFELVGMDLLGIQAETRGEAERFSRERGVAYPLAYDEGGLLYSHFNARVLRPPLPLTVFADARGIVVERHFGPLTERQLRGKLFDLFGID